MNLLFAAQSGWGKSWHAQAWLERNLPNYSHGVILDFKDEYRGLVLEDLAQHWLVGDVEEDWSVDDWRSMLGSNPRLVLARHSRLGEMTWRDVCDRIIQAARSLDDSVLVGVDEAHFVAPQKTKVPDAIEGLATTGRGEDASSIWITQRLTRIDETVASCCQSRILGGFESSGDLGKIRQIIEYPNALHNPQQDPDPSTIPDELLPDDRDRPTSLQVEKRGEAIDNSEWIYSDNSGERRRINSRDVSMRSTHYGSEGKSLDPPA